MSKREEFLKSPIEFLKGVGPHRAELLQSELKIRQFKDLLEYFPFRYVDKSQYHSIGLGFADGQMVQLKGSISSIKTLQAKKKRLVAKFTDKTGEIDLVWFQGIKWIEKSLKKDEPMTIYGKVNFFKGSRNIMHPEIEYIKDQEELSHKSNFDPVYSTTEKLSKKGLASKGFKKICWNLINQIHPSHLAESLPKPLIEKYRLCARFDALKEIHFPRDQEHLDIARRRIKFEEFFFHQIILLKSKINRAHKLGGHIFKEVGENFNEFYHKHLQFELTNAQKKVIKEIRQDLGSGIHMNRLLQGDVGSGKTIVSLMTMLIAIDNGYQACIMAPTEILANQHYQGISELLQEMNVNVKLLTGSVKKKDRIPIHEGLQSGEIDILIGTHALLEPGVVFKNLGMAVTDEQHRFGVAQRAKLWAKNKVHPPHILVMTATPIPRTLAMTTYGDLDVSVIDELPPGRKPVKTIHRSEAKRTEVIDFIRKQITIGRQVYVVYPLIEESETLDLQNLHDGYGQLLQAFPRPEYQISVVHGRMKAEDKESEMQRFVAKKTQIMVATTVIEVGVNVPNASVMVIENTERFGLSQLHQLRGRVGRGADQSFCILMSSYKLTKEAKKRIQTMCETNDGFKVAEVDLQLRGPGDIEGTRQSGGKEFKLASLVYDQAILSAARAEAIEILTADPKLEKEENLAIRHFIKNDKVYRQNWSLIS